MKTKNLYKSKQPPLHFDHKKSKNVSRTANFVCETATLQIFYRKRNNSSKKNFWKFGKLLVFLINRANVVCIDVVKIDDLFQQDRQKDLTTKSWIRL